MEMLLINAGEAVYLGAFSKFRKAIISFVISIYPSARPHGTTRLPLAWYVSNLLFEHFLKSFEEIRVTKKTVILHEDPRTFMITSRWIFLRMRNVSDPSCREKSKHTFYVNNLFSSSSSNILRCEDNVEMCAVARQDTDDNIIRRIPCSG
jgi:hypothetical protein